MMVDNTAHSSGAPFHDIPRQQLPPHPQQHQQDAPPPHQNHPQQHNVSGPIVWNTHNPFDVNSYPMTNPPIIDSTFFLPYTNEAGVQRRRRYSISNGQIGQIVNHEAFFADDDSHDDGSDVPFKYTSEQSTGAVAPGTHAVGEPPIYGPPIDPYDLASHPPHADFVPQSHHRLPQGPKIEDTKDQVQPLIHGPGAGQPPTLAQQGPQPSFSHAHSAPPQNLHPAQTEGLIDEKSNRTALENVAGVPPPNHSLIYNNEVIYTADGGPIPGTAAWKKERLLERNRIAASKCRQRKKQAQQQLQSSISKYEQEMKEQREKLEKYEKLLRVYNKTLGDFFSNKSSSIESLRPYVEKSIKELGEEKVSRTTVKPDPYQP